MFRNDFLTVKRENYTVVDNLATKSYETIYENIPCHLSVNLNNTANIQNTPYINAEFTIYLNADEKIQIKENDKLFVVTPQNRTYELIAGETKTYNLTTQIKCRQEKIIESDFDVNWWNKKINKKCRCKSW